MIFTHITSVRNVNILDIVNVLLVKIFDTVEVCIQLLRTL